MYTLFRRLRAAVRQSLRELQLELARSRMLRVPDGGRLTVGGLSLRVTDGLNAYMQYKDELVRRCYAFETSRPDPVVIDGGANIGMFSLATLRDHPDARITAFEPDPRIAAMLKENLANNNAAQVAIVIAALGPADGEMSFAPDGQAGGALVAGAAPMRVHAVTLSQYLTDEVDFLKLNIEGAELDVLREAAASNCLRRVRAMVIEYHGWPGGEQRLGPLLDLLNGQQFRYLVHDLDAQTNPRTKPPFRDPGDEPWFALVYAWRIGVLA